MIYKYRWLLLIIFFAGLVILLLPDKSRSVVQLNKQHRPSIADLAGLSLMLFSWLMSAIFIIKNRSNLTGKFGNQVLGILIAVYIISIAGIITGLNLSIEWVLWVSVAVATTINILFIISAFKVALNKTLHAN